MAGGSTLKWIVSCIQRLKVIRGMTSGNVILQERVAVGVVLKNCTRKQALAFIDALELFGLGLAGVVSRA